MERSAIPYFGRGSNLLFTQPEIPRVLAVRMLGLELLKETKSYVEIEVGAGSLGTLWLCKPYNPVGMA